MLDGIDDARVAVQPLTKGYPGGGHKRHKKRLEETDPKDKQSHHHSKHAKDHRIGMAGRQPL